MPGRHVSLLTCLAVVASLLFADLAHASDADRSAMLRHAVRIRYERTENGALITGHGTAFGVNLTDWGLSGRRYLLTAAHNVLDNSNKPYGTLKIEITEGTRTYWSQCKVLLVDADLDLCVVESGDDVPSICELATSDEALGARVVMAGSPRGVPVALYDGIMGQRYYRGAARSVVDVQFDHGCSGGPLYSAKTGKAVGVAVAGIPMDRDLDPTKGLFVPVGAIESFLERLGKSPARRASPVAERVVAQAPASVTVPAPEPVRVTPAPTPVPAAAVVPVPVAVIQAPAQVSAKLPEPTASKPANVELPRPVRAEPVPTVAASSTTSTQAAVEFLDPETPPSVPAVYVIEDGDNLTRIARRFKTTVETLISLNSIKDPNRILVGSKLRLK
ncbi:MAG TPA: LysM peptidoglycan-binding domain-containing protein [Planctomycetota bacterium]|nr:LysM peptidoglycan-binding domain-containing protein [Planctomycetota bacterium]